MGSLVTALASYLDVKQHDGSWFVRIDDIDPPREAAGAKDQILTSLAAHGFESDRAVDYQSDHRHSYDEALDALSTQCFYCRCTRKSLRGISVYPGTCRARTEPTEDAAIRLRAVPDTAHYDDRVLGPQSQVFGDFIVCRRDGLVAYNLATAVDDGSAAVTTVLRGQDLIDVTGPQIHTMQRLELDPPEYAHIPTLNYEDGTKLSKQTGAPPLDDDKAAHNLRAALFYLGLHAPADLSVAQYLRWGLEHWSLEHVPSSLPPFGAHGES